jgi:acetyl esterase/lipase
MPFMKKLSRILGFVSAFFGLLTLIRSPKGRAGGVMWLPKLWAGAWAPFFGIAGAIGALIGFIYGDREATVSGLFGTFNGIRHTVRVTKRHDAFDLAFGKDWEQRIDPDLWKRLSRPYQLIQPSKPIGLYQRDVNIGSASPLYCDLWLPPSEVKRTRLGVIFLHGGLMQALDKDFLSRPLFQRLVNQGHAVMDVAYSLAPEADIKKIMDDVKLSIIWMKANAARLGIDPERIVLIGSSGGSLLALLAAYTPNFPAFQPKRVKADTSVRGVISLMSISDMVSFFHEYGESNPDQPESSSQITEDMLPRVFDKTWLDKFMTCSRAFPAYRYSNMPGGALLLINLFGGTLNEVPEKYTLYSPLTHVGTHCPPTLQICGDDDFVVNASQGRKLHHALQTANIPSVYVELPDTFHRFDQYFGVSRRVAPAAQVATNDIEQFLALMV